MDDESALDDLTIEELETILDAKRRARALRRFRRVTDAVAGEPGASDGVSERLGEQAAVPAHRAGGRKYPPVGAAAREAPAGDDPTSFKPVTVIPERNVVGGALSFVTRAGKGFWLRGFSRLRDRLLLLLELAALAGLIFVIYSTFSNLRDLNREVAEALEVEQGATPAASPVNMLPGGSVPPGAAGTVPDPYRHLVEPGASIPIPTPGPRQASRMTIPAINVDAPVVEGDGWEELKMGAGHRIGSANPGERGNMVISGHNDVYGEIFRHLEDVRIGDEVIVYAGDTPYRYSVVARMVVEPTEVSLLEPTPNATLTLITCHPYMVDTHRLVVIAELANQ
jgi:sortase A